MVKNGFTTAQKSFSLLIINKITNQLADVD